MALALQGTVLTQTAPFSPPKRSAERVRQTGLALFMLWQVMLRPTPSSRELCQWHESKFTRP
jgi:hypothetical protein